MPLEHLTASERNVVAGCLRAVVEGPFFDDDEYHPMFGLSRVEMADLLARWPRLSESEDEVMRGLNNAMNNLLIWYGWQDEEPERGARLLREWTGATPDEIERVFYKWREGRG